MKNGVDRWTTDSTALSFSIVETQTETETLIIILSPLPKTHSSSHLLLHQFEFGASWFEFHRPQHYLNHSCTQFHATAEAKQQLLAAGFHMLNENKDWHLKPGGRYFFTRNMSCLIAFAIGDKSAHFTSSPSLFYFSLSPNVIVSLLVFC